MSRLELSGKLRIAGLLLGTVLAIFSAVPVSMGQATEPPLPIVRGDTWRYLKGTAQPPAEWNTVGFDDAGWLSGASGIGYGDGDDATVLSDMQNGYSTVYMRRLFDVPSPSAIDGLDLKMDYDDGFVAYLNGVEVARRNVPAGSLTFSSLASASHEASGGASGNAPETISLNSFLGQLIPGTNVLAVHALNATLGSSDLTLIAELRVSNAPPASSSPSPAPGSASVPLNPTLCVDVDDPDGSPLTTTFFGREVTGVPGEEFTIIALPDTQYYSASFPSTYTTQTQWIVDNRLPRNIVFVTQLGDCVDNASINQQFVNADAGWSVIEDNPYTGQPFGLPFGIAVGNHDQTPAGDPGTLAAEGSTTSAFNSWFGVSRFTGRGYYGGHYGINNDNHFELFSGGGMDFVALHLEFMPSNTPLRQAVLAWADSVLKAYPGRRAMVTTHYMLESGSSTAFGNQGQAIYEALKGNPNLFMMLGGHLDQASRRVDTFNGSTVYTLKSDYQSRPNGGNGWLRIMSFSPANGTIHVETYSPTIGQFINTHADNTAGTAQNDFVLSYDMDGGSPFVTIGSDIEASGGTACVSWPGRQPGRTYEWYTTISDGTDATTSARYGFTTALTCTQDTDCADGSLCNGEETCVNSECQAGTPPDCDDADACTADTCDPINGCSNVVIDCGDNDLCTTDSCDTLSGCAHEPVSCPQGEVCDVETGFCEEPATVCSTTPDCVDADPCTIDACVGGNVSALNFAGTNDYVTMGAAAGETALGARAFTLEAWVRRDGASWGATTSTGTGGVTAVPLVTKGRGEAEGTNVDANYFLGITAAGRPVADFEQFAAGGGWSAGQNHPACSSASITDQSWHHVAVTYGTTDGWRFYLDGVEGTTADGTSCTTCSPAGSCPQNPGVEPRYDSIQHFGLGTAMTSAPAAAGSYAGVLDEVRVWNRVLTQAEIQAGLTQEIASATNLIGRWDLDENGGATAADSTSPAQNGTLTAGPAWSAADKAPLTGLCSHQTIPGCHPCNGDEECLDTNLCNGTETCSGGVCQAGTTLSCDDADACTVDSCDPVDGCQQAVATCDDGVACTLDSCDPETGCEYVADCPFGEVCSFGTGLCVPQCGTAGDCDDTNACTTDACVGGNAFSLQLNGTSQYVSMGAAPGLNASQFTIETWFRRTGDGTVTETGAEGIEFLVPLVAKGAAQTDESNVDGNYILGINTDGNVIAADFEEGVGGPGPLGQNHPVSGTTPIVNNTWYHAAATYDGTTWRLYLNGNLEVTQVVNAPVRSDSIQHFGLGTTLTSTGTAAGFFAGELDEVRVWNRTLSQAEIQVNMDVPLTSGSGLIGRWGFEDGATVTDSTAPAENGSLFNAPVFDPMDKPILQAGTCSHSPVTCSDGDPCTIDSCDMVQGCVFTPASNGTACDDGSACTSGDACTAGVCGGSPETSLCDDGNSCSVDACADAPAQGALSFDGSNDYVTFGVASELGNAQFTVETWFLKTGDGGSNQTGMGGITALIPLMAKGAPEADESNVDANWILGINTAGNVLAADFEDTANGQNHPVSGTTPLVNGVWYHAAATYDGTTWRLYLNGNPEATLVVGSFTPRSDSIQHAALGAMLTSTGTRLGAFQGVLDEARVWSYARGQAEILAGSTRRFVSTPGLVGRWGLDEGTGATAFDSTSPASNGTLTNFNLTTAWVAGAPALTAVSCSSSALPNGSSCTADSNACTADTCTAGVCGAAYAPTPGCCLEDAQCDDGSTTSVDVCLSGSCQNAAPVSCTAAAECNDANACSADTCVGANVSALNFGGVSDYVTMGAAAGEAALGARAFTLEAWIRRDGASWGATTNTGTGGVTAVPLVTKGRGEAENSNVDCNYFLGITATGRPVADFEQFAAAGGWAAGQNHPACSSASITDQSWHHVAVTYSTAAGWRFYIDGVEGTTADGTSCTTCSPAGSCPQSPGVEPRYDSVQHFGLGTAMTSAPAAAGFYGGVMDEARVWNRVLTQAEIQAGMSQEITSATNLIGRWGLNDNAGTSVADSTAPAQNGTFSGSPAWSPGDKAPIAGICHHTAGGAGATCRASVGQCDVAETCSGSSSFCPSNLSQPNGTGCSDGNACTQNDTCQSGSCAPGTPLPPPAEASNVIFGADSITLDWDSLPGAAPPVVYDVARGLMTLPPIDSGANGACTDTGIGVPQATDASVPAVGEIFWYLIRGRDTCGEGTWGFAQSNGVPTTERQVNSACP